MSPANYLNTTFNETQPSNCSSSSNPAEKIGKTFAYCLILVVSSAGNSLIGIIVYKTKTTHRTINYLIVNMAMSDLLFPIFLFPRILTEMYGNGWIISGPLGKAVCNFAPFLHYISSVVSVESLVLIAVDRFGAVVFPLRPRLIASRLCSTFILTTWIIAVFLTSPYFFHIILVQYPRNDMCTVQWNEAFVDENWHQVLLHFFIVISFALTAILYSIILLKLKSQKLPGEQSVNAEDQRLQRHRNSLKMVIAIVLGFALCWLPFNIFTFLFLFVWDDTTSFSCGILPYRFIVRFMAQANCAINPCICFIFCQNYRQGLKRLLCRDCAILPE